MIFGDAGKNVKYVRQKRVMAMSLSLSPYKCDQRLSSPQPAVSVKPASDLLAPRKGGIRVGAQYQAEVPAAPVTELSVGDCSAGQEARWTPEHKLTEQQVNQFVLLTR